MGLINTTDQDYYAGNDHGSYQFTSLEDIINNFVIAYVGEGKIISKIKRTETSNALFCLDIGPLVRDLQERGKMRIQQRQLRIKLMFHKYFLPTIVPIDINFLTDSILILVLTS